MRRWEWKGQIMPSITMKIFLLHEESPDNAFKKYWVSSHHVSVQNQAMASRHRENESKVLTKVFRDPHEQSRLPVCPYPLIHSVPAIPLSFPFLKHSIHGLSSLRTFALTVSSSQNTFPPDILMALSPISFRNLLKCYLFNKIPPGYLSKTATPSPLSKLFWYSLTPLFAVFFSLSVHIHLNCYLFYNIFCLLLLYPQRHPIVVYNCKKEIF